MILHGFGPAWDCIDASPFVTKLATWLRMAGIPFELRVGDVRKVPRGKLPALTLDDGTTLVDSQAIIEQLSRQHNDPLNEAGFSAKDRAVAHAFRALFESELYFAAVYLRWAPDDNWQKLQPVIVNYLRQVGVPGLLAGPVSNMVRKKSVQQTKAQGTGRRPIEQIHALASQVYSDASRFLADKPFMLGDRPSALDATAFAFIHAVLGSRFEGCAGDLAPQLRKHPNVLAYHDRMLQAYWPERVRKP